MHACFIAGERRVLWSFVMSVNCTLICAVWNFRQSCEWNEYRLHIVSLPRPTASSGWKFSFLFSLSPNICKYLCLSTHFVPDNRALIDLWNVLKTTIVTLSRLRVNPLKPEFNIVTFIHYKPRISTAILDLYWMKMTWCGVKIKENWHVLVKPYL